MSLLYPLKWIFEVHEYVRNIMLLQGLIFVDLMSNGFYEYGIFVVMKRFGLFHSKTFSSLCWRVFFSSFSRFFFRYETLENAIILSSRRGTFFLIFCIVFRLCGIVKRTHWFYRPVEFQYWLIFGTITYAIPQSSLFSSPNLRWISEDWVVRIPVIVDFTWEY